MASQFLNLAFRSYCYIVTCPGSLLIVKGRAISKLGCGLALFDLHASFSKLSWKRKQNFTHTWLTQGNQETASLSSLGNIPWILPGIQGKGHMQSEAKGQWAQTPDTVSHNSMLGLQVFPLGRGNTSLWNPFVPRKRLWLNFISRQVSTPYLH